MRRAEVSCNNQLYSERQTVYTVEVKKGHMNEVSGPKGKLPLSSKSQVARVCFSIKAFK